MLEASGFDFRNRYPQNLALKLAKHYHVDRDTVGKTAYNISLDLYRTLAPLKQTTATMAIACVELSGRINERPISELEAGMTYKRWKTSRPEVMGMPTHYLVNDRPYLIMSFPETLLDLLDLYTHHRASTIVGQDHALETFISVRIALNQEASANQYPRHSQSHRERSATNGAKAANCTIEPKAKNQLTPTTSPRNDTLRDITSPTANGGSKPGLKDGTVRFMLNPQRARDEKNAVAEFFKVEEEEYEVEVERERRRV